MRVKKHAWIGDDGRVCAKEASIWLFNLILMAGSKASTAAQCAHLLAKDIEDHPEKFK